MTDTRIALGDHVRWGKMTIMGVVNLTHAGIVLGFDGRARAFVRQTWPRSKKRGENTVVRLGLEELTTADRTVIDEKE